MLETNTIKEALPSYLQFLFTIHWTKVSNTELIILAFGLLILSITVYYIYKYFQWRRHISQKYVLLEVKPPSISLQSAFSTKQLFTIFHSLDHDDSFLDRLLQVKKPVSYEIVSTKEEGIRYVFHAPEEDVTIIKKNLLSYLPGVMVAVIKDYLPQAVAGLQTKEFSLYEFQLKKSYVLPLQEQDILNKHDPIAYITGQMTKQDPHELIALQFVTAPVTGRFHSNVMEHILNLNKRIYQGKEIISCLNTNMSRSFFSLAKSIIDLLFLIIFDIAKTFGNWLMDFVMSSRNSPYKYIRVQDLRHGESIQELTPKQKHVQDLVEKKINQNLFETTIRLLVVSSDKKTAALRIKGITSSFATFNNPGYQSLQAKNSIPLSSSFFTKLSYLKLKHRLLSSDSPIVSVSELSSFYHFPYTNSAQTENMITTRSAQLPAPLTLKKANGELDITFAHNIHGGAITPIGLTLEERRRHMYVIGATGMGKTTLLSQMIYQDIVNGKGVAILDPHGDLSERLLGVIPKERIQDVVYFNPYDIEFPIGLNLLEMREGLSAVEEQREKDLIVSSLVSIYFKLYPSANARPRMEHVLRNAVLTALTVKEPTLLTVYKLLIDKSFRNGVVEKLTDPILKDYWKKEFEGFGSYQKAELIAPITNKLGRFLTTTITRNILTQKTSKLNFEDIMNNKKILICDLSKGKIGEDISSFIGSLLIVKIQLAALNRVHTPQEQRTDFFLYIDEFQNFATMTFAQILSEARKYRLNTIRAHQTISQIDDKDLLKVILANVGTVISFRTSNPTDEDFILPLFKPQVKEHEIANLPSYSFYIKINALHPQDAFTGTIEDFSVHEDSKIRQRVIDQSRITYGVKVEHITEEVENGNGSAKKALKKSKKTVEKPKQKPVIERGYIV